MMTTKLDNHTTNHDVSPRIRTFVAHLKTKGDIDGLRMLRNLIENIAPEWWHLMPPLPEDNAQWVGAKDRWMKGEG